MACLRPFVVTYSRGVQIPGDRLTCRSLEVPVPSCNAWTRVHFILCLQKLKKNHTQKVLQWTTPKEGTQNLSFKNEDLPQWDLRPHAGCRHRLCGGRGLRKPAGIVSSTGGHLGDMPEGLGAAASPKSHYALQGQRLEEEETAHGGSHCPQCWHLGTWKAPPCSRGAQVSCWEAQSPLIPPGSAVYAQPASARLPGGCQQQQKNLQDAHRGVLPLLLGASSVFVISLK